MGDNEISSDDASKLNKYLEAEIKLFEDISNSNKIKSKKYYLYMLQVLKEKNKALTKIIEEKSKVTKGDFQTVLTTRESLIEIIFLNYYNNKVVQQKIDEFIKQKSSVLQVSSELKQKFTNLSVSTEGSKEKTRQFGFETLDEKIKKIFTYSELPNLKKLIIDIFENQNTISTLSNLLVSSLSSNIDLNNVQIKNNLTSITSITTNIEKLSSQADIKSLKIDANSFENIKSTILGILQKGDDNELINNVSVNKIIHKFIDDIAVSQKETRTVTKVLINLITQLSTKLVELKNLLTSNNQNFDFERNIQNFVSTLSSDKQKKDLILNSIDLIKYETSLQKLDNIVERYFLFLDEDERYKILEPVYYKGIKVSEDIKIPVTFISKLGQQRSRIKFKYRISSIVFSVFQSVSSVHFISLLFDFSKEGQENIMKVTKLDIRGKDNQVILTKKFKYANSFNIDYKFLKEEMEITDKKLFVYEVLYEDLNYGNKQDIKIEGQKKKEIKDINLVELKVKDQQQMKQIENNIDEILKHLNPTREENNLFNNAIKEMFKNLIQIKDYFKQDSKKSYVIENNVEGFYVTEILSSAFIILDRFKRVFSLENPISKLKDFLILLYDYINKKMVDRLNSTISLSRYKEMKEIYNDFCKEIISKTSSKIKNLEFFKVVSASQRNVKYFFETVYELKDTINIFLEKIKSATASSGQGQPSGTSSDIQTVKIDILAKFSSPDPSNTIKNISEKLITVRDRSNIFLNLQTLDFFSNVKDYKKAKELSSDGEENLNNIYKVLFTYKNIFEILNNFDGISNIVKDLRIVIDKIKNVCNDPNTQLGNLPSKFQYDLPIVNILSVNRYIPEALQKIANFTTIKQEVKKTEPGKKIKKEDFSKKFENLKKRIYEILEAQKTTTEIEKFVNELFKLKLEKEQIDTSQIKNETQEKKTLEELKDLIERFNNLKSSLDFTVTNSIFKRQPPPQPPQSTVTPAVTPVVTQSQQQQSQQKQPQQQPQQPKRQQQQKQQQRQQKPKTKNKKPNVGQGKKGITQQGKFVQKSKLVENKK